LAPHRAPKEKLDPRQRYEFGEGEHATRIAPSFATLCLGGLALLTTAGAWAPALRWLAWIDLPFAFVLFTLCAWISLTDQRETAKSLPGLIASAVAVAISVIHLMIDPAHPWAG